VPTAAGREYLVCAHQMELMKMDFDRKLSQFVRGDRGVLHVGSMRHRNLYLFPRLIRNFQNIYPGIQVVLYDSSPTDLEKMLKDGDLDLILTNQPVENPSLSVHPIYEDRLGMVLGAAETLRKMGTQYAVFGSASGAG
jgi:DNA-binding transcriptional LysR family regulator